MQEENLQVQKRRILFESKGLFETDLRVPSYNKKQIAVAQKGVHHEILCYALFETDVL